MSLKYFTHATPTLFNAGTPRPQLSSCYLIAMEKLGVLPLETVIVEDSPYGIMAAKASGATVVTVKSVDEVTLDLLHGVVPGILQ